MPSSKRRISKRQALLKVEQQRDSLIEQVTDELKRREQLQQHTEILSALCDSLLYVLPGRQHQLLQQQKFQLQQQQDGVLQRVMELLEAEGRFLARLQGLPAVQHELLQAAGVDNTGQPTIAPPEDPMALFKEVTSRPPAANASRWVCFSQITPGTCLGGVYRSTAGAFLPHCVQKRLAQRHGSVCSGWKGWKPSCLCGWLCGVGGFAWVPSFQTVPSADS
jgi:hypothetical protein